MSPRRLSKFAVATAIAVLPTLVEAHPGHGPGAELGVGFHAGLLHPWSGLDHLLAMVAIGMWAAQLGGRTRWMLPMCFVSLMLVGASVGFAGVASNAVEQGIAASVLILGLALASAKRVPLLLSMVLTGCFAIFHGYAHGVELPAQSSALSYLFGFVLSTTALHLMGLAIGHRLTNNAVLRWTGAVIALSGAAMLVV
jgi:urease accessory protein